MADDPKKLRLALRVLQMNLDAAIRRTRVGTPIACDTCVHRESEWRDGGWCYMFRNMPSPTCSQYQANG